MKKANSKTSFSVHRSSDKLKADLANLQGEQLKESEFLHKLMRPPSVYQKKNANLPKKYDPKFEKPDIQTLIQENTTLKQQLKNDKQAIISMKFKIGESQKKIKSLQNAMNKYEYFMNGAQNGNFKTNADQTQTEDKIKSFEEIKLDKFRNIENIQKGHLKKSERRSEKMEKLINQTDSKFNKTQAKNQAVILPVYTQILKKKIQELNVQYSNAQSQIRQLKRLPNASIFQENNIEKEHLITETIRLKAIITSLSEAENHDNDQFQNQFLKLMKQENQKLKATIRLLENDKNLLKSRQSIQKKLNNDLKKEIQHLKMKLSNKQADVQRLDSENKNLMFKKVTQYNLQQQKKDSEEFLRINRRIQELQKQNVRLQYQKDQYYSQNHTLKEKQKHKDLTFGESMQKLMRQKKESQEKVKELEADLRKLLDEYNYVVNNSTQKKKKERMEVNKIEKVDINKPVKFEDIELALLIFITLINNDKINLDYLFEDSTELKCGELINIFMEEPIKLQKKDAVKLARYMVEVNNKDKIPYDDNAVISKEFGITILRSSINLLKRSLNTQNQNTWRLIIAKNKKIMNQFEGFKDQCMKKQKFIDLLSKNIRERIEIQYITMITLLCFDYEQSKYEIVLETKKIMQIFSKISNNESIL